MLRTGTRIGPYEILGPLGAGGMGEVHRARDTRLDREVAIKLLPRTFGEDPDRRVRFDREAKVLASLNHPNIAQVYGVEEIERSLAIVMELVPGEDLNARIRRGPLPWLEARPIARQLAVGLDAAHERGIIHRDLKPANVRLTPDDTVKILDFGLAKAFLPDGNAQDPALSPTFTSPATDLGVILGTAPYMAPEQAKGRPVDKRADIWAFGVVVYEMLTATSPFAADSVIESLGLAVTRDPDWTAIPATVPERVVELLKRCLAKDPRLRLRDIGDAIHIFDERAPGPPVEHVTASVRRRSPALRTIVIVAIAAAAAAALAWTFKPSSSLPLRRFELPERVAQYSTPAISPDGRYLAYVADGRVLVRTLDEDDARELTPQHPTTGMLAWSPDSRSLAYVSEGSIRTVPVSGGAVFTVATIPGSRRVNDLLWRADGSILLAVWSDGLYRVNASGGTPELALKIDSATEVDFHELSVAPEDRLVIGVHQRATNLLRSELVRLGTSAERLVLLEDATVRDLRYAWPGRVLFLRLGANRGLWSMPFDDHRLDLASATLVAARATSFSASGEGTLIARSDRGSKSRLEWLGRDGTTTSIPGSPIVDLVGSIAPTPEGDRVAYVAGRTAPSLFVRDLTTGADRRLTAEGSAQDLEVGALVKNPGWLPGAVRVFYEQAPGGTPQIVARRADGLGEETQLAPGSFGRVSADGRWFGWLESERGQSRLRYAPLQGEKLGEVRTFDATNNEDIGTFAFSPDGSLLVYTVRGSNLQSNIFLMDFPGATGRWQVTSSGAVSPMFLGPANDIVFMAGGRNERGELGGRLVLMPMTQRPTVKVGVATTLLSGAATPNTFATTRDGRLLIAAPVADPEARSHAVLVQNWPAAVDRR